MWKTIIKRIKRSFIHLQLKPYKMTTTKQKAQLTREINQLKQFMADVKSTRKGNVRFWYYMGEMWNTYKYLKLIHELNELLRKRSNLDSLTQK